MALKKQDLLEMLNDKHFGIRIELINKETNKILNFGDLKNLLPFFKSAGIEFIELGNLNAFDRKTKKNISIFAKEPALISPSHWQEILPNLSDVQNLTFSEIKAAVYKQVANKRLLPPSNLINFEKNNAFWLQDYVYFSALSEYIGTSKFSDWPDNVCTHDRKTLGIISKQLSNQILVEKLLQNFVHQSYKDFVESAHKYGIYISIDLELICDEHSSEIWGNSELFYLNKNLLPTVYIGLPPSKLLKNGIKFRQVPYRWQELYNEHFEFFRQLFKHHESDCDYIHLLHGYSFFHYWEVAHFENDPQHGRWVPIKFDLFFEYVRNHFSNFPYFFDFNEPLFPKYELMLKRYFLLQSVILGEPINHTCADYDLSRPIHMIRSKLCNMKTAYSKEKRGLILKAAKANLKTILQEEINMKVIHIDEICAILGISLEEIFAQPQHYGKILGGLLRKDSIATSETTDTSYEKPKSSIFSNIVSSIKKHLS